MWTEHAGPVLFLFLSAYRGRLGIGRSFVSIVVIVVDQRPLDPRRFCFSCLRYAFPL